MCVQHRSPSVPVRCKHECYFHIATLSLSRNDAQYSWSDTFILILLCADASYSTKKLPKTYDDSVMAGMSLCIEQHEIGWKVQQRLHGKWAIDTCIVCSPYHSKYTAIRIRWIEFVLRMVNTSSLSKCQTYQISSAANYFIELWINWKCSDFTAIANILYRTSHYFYAFEYIFFSRLSYWKIECEHI